LKVIGKRRMSSDLLDEHQDSIDVADPRAAATRGSVPQRTEQTRPSNRMTQPFVGV